MEYHQMKARTIDLVSAPLLIAGTLITEHHLFSQVSSDQCPLRYVIIWFITNTELSEFQSNTAQISNGLRCRYNLIR